MLNIDSLFLQETEMHPGQYYLLHRDNEWNQLMADKILLKKYANRRLYDTRQSKYVTLNEVAGFVRDGQEVAVVDAKTKEDVTAFILTQILMEEAKNRNVLLPVPLLSMIIRYGDNILVDFFEKYLQQIIKSYLAYKSAMDDQFKQWLDMGAGVSGEAQKKLLQANPFQSLFDNLFRGPAGGKSGERE